MKLRKLRADRVDILTADHHSSQSICRPRNRLKDPADYPNAVL